MVGLSVVMPGGRWHWLTVIAGVAGLALVAAHIRAMRKHGSRALHGFDRVNAWLDVIPLVVYLGTIGCAFVDRAPERPDPRLPNPLARLLSSFEAFAFMSFRRDANGDTSPLERRAKTALDPKNNSHLAESTSARLEANHANDFGCRCSRAREHAYPDTAARRTGPARSPGAGAAARPWRVAGGCDRPRRRVLSGGDAFGRLRTQIGAEIAAMPGRGRPSALRLSELDRLRAPRARGLNR
jgi:hypothetical protein